MKVEIHNNYTKVVESTEEELDLLSKLCLLEYLYYGIDYTRKPFRRKKQTGYLNYYTKGHFPTGWFHTIYRAFQADNKQIEWQDLRLKPSASERIDIGHTPNLPIPYDYQVEAIDRGLSKGRGIMHHATGAGKTVLQAHLMKRLGFRTLNIVPSVILLDQNHGEFSHFLGEKYMGKIGDGIYDPRYFDVATIQTLWSHYTRDPQGFKEFLAGYPVIMFDESHHISFSKDGKPKNTYFKIALMSNAYYRYGFSATPGDEGSIDLTTLIAATGNVIHHISSSDLIRKGRLTRPKIQMIRVEHEKLSNWQEAYTQSITSNEERNYIIVTLARFLASHGLSVLITVDRVETHGKVLADMMPEAVFMSGATAGEDRVSMIEEFSNKTKKILISTVVKEGVNIPSMDSIIRAEGGKSDKKTTQIVGRVLRKSEGKYSSLVYDFFDDDDKGMLSKQSKKRKASYKEEDEFIVLPDIDVEALMEEIGAASEIE